MDGAVDSAIIPKTVWTCNVVRLAASFSNSNYKERRLKSLTSTLGLSLLQSQPSTHIRETQQLIQQAKETKVKNDSSSQS